MRESRADQPVVVETLAAFVRERTGTGGSALIMPQPPGDVHVTLTAAGTLQSASRVRPASSAREDTPSLA
jgi:hypothetical protein